MKRILLVEGMDDKHVALHISESRGIDLSEVEIDLCGGIERLLDRFRVEIKNTKVGTIGVIVDADDDLMSRWESIRDRLCQAGYPSVPRRPLASGTIISVPDGGAILPTIGVWIMPDNGTGGMLEDFLALLVPSYPDNKLFKHAEHSVSDIPNDSILFSTSARSKAIIYTWLAWQRNPGRPFGVAIKKRFFDSNAPKADEFAEWMKELLAS